MKTTQVLCKIILVSLLLPAVARAQEVGSGTSGGTTAPVSTAPPANPTSSPQPPSGAIPRLVKFSGSVMDLAGKPVTGVLGLTFALYEQSEGGTPLWQETQTLALNAQGHYAALLGAETPGGLPLELFTGSQALWVGVQPQMPGQSELPRALLVAVPYALKSSDADTLGGLPASAYMLAPNANATAGAVTPGVPIVIQPPGGTVPPPGSGSGAPASGIGGSGTPNFIPMFTAPNTIGNSPISIISGGAGGGVASQAGVTPSTGGVPSGSGDPSVSVDSQFSITSPGGSPGLTVNQNSTGSEPAIEVNITGAMLPPMMSGTYNGVVEFSVLGNGGVMTPTVNTTKPVDGTVKVGAAVAIGGDGRVHLKGSTESLYGTVFSFTPTGPGGFPTAVIALSGSTNLAVTNYSAIVAGNTYSVISDPNTPYQFMVIAPGTMPGVPVYGIVTGSPNSDGTVPAELTDNLQSQTTNFVSPWVSNFSAANGITTNPSLCTSTSTSCTVQNDPSQVTVNLGGWTFLKSVTIPVLTVQGAASVGSLTGDSATLQGLSTTSVNISPSAGSTQSAIQITGNGSSPFFQASNASGASVFTVGLDGTMSGAAGAVSLGTANIPGTILLGAFGSGGSGSGISGNCPGASGGNGGTIAVTAGGCISLAQSYLHEYGGGGGDDSGYGGGASYSGGGAGGSGGYYSASGGSGGSSGGGGGTGSMSGGGGGGGYGGSGGSISASGGDSGVSPSAPGGGGNVDIEGGLGGNGLNVNGTSGSVLLNNANPSSVVVGQGGSPMSGQSLVVAGNTTTTGTATVASLCFAAVGCMNSPSSGSLAATNGLQISNGEIGLNTSIFPTVSASQIALNTNSLTNTGAISAGGGNIQLLANGNINLTGNAIANGSLTSSLVSTPTISGNGAGGSISLAATSGSILIGNTSEGGAGGAFLGGGGGGRINLSGSSTADANFFISGTGGSTGVSITGNAAGEQGANSGGGVAFQTGTFSPAGFTANGPFTVMDVNTGITFGTNTPPGPETWVAIGADGTIWYNTQTINGDIIVQPSAQPNASAPVTGGGIYFNYNYLSPTSNSPSPGYFLWRPALNGLVTTGTSQGPVVQRLFTGSDWATAAGVLAKSKSEKNGLTPEQAGAPFETNTFFDLNGNLWIPEIIDPNTGFQTNLPLTGCQNNYTLAFETANEPSPWTCVASAGGGGGGISSVAATLPLVSATNSGAVTVGLESCPSGEGYVESAAGGFACTTLLTSGGTAFFSTSTNYLDAVTITSSATSGGGGLFASASGELSDSVDASNSGEYGTALYGSASGSEGTGVFGNSSNGEGGYGGSFQGDTGIEASVTPKGTNAGVFNGNITVNGTTISSVVLADNSLVELYGMQSTENWSEDFGSAELRNGVAEVTLDPTFAQATNVDSSYHVFLTPNGDCEGLFVAHKTPTGFQVRELRGGKSNVAFDYRIVAKRRGFEHLRMEPIETDEATVRAIRAAQQNQPAHHKLNLPKPPQPPAAPSPAPRANDSINGLPAPAKEAMP